MKHNDNVWIGGHVGLYPIWLNFCVTCRKNEEDESSLGNVCIEGRMAAILLNHKQPDLFSLPFTN